MSSEQRGEQERPSEEGILYVLRKRFLDLFGVEQLTVGSSFTLELDENLSDQFSNKRHYVNLNLLHRLFIIAENPNSCLLGKLWSLSVALITVISVVMYVLDSLSELSFSPTTCDYPVCNNDPVLCPGRMICEPQSLPTLIEIENACLYIFIADYFTRFFLCGIVPSHMAGVALKPEMGSEDYFVDLAAYDDLKNASSEGKTKCTNSSITPDENMEEKIETAKTAMENMETKKTYWKGIEEKSEKSPYFFAYLHIFRPVTEEDYHPNQDPIYTWYYQTFLYTTKVMNMIDFVAILPFFIALTASKGSSFSVVRVLRLARVLRVLKLGKGSKGMVILFETVRDSLPALSILAFFSLIGVVLLGAIQFFCEGGNFQLGPDGRPNYYRIDKDSLGQEPTPFSSIPMAMYWTVITSTTVGFGDIYPTSYFGRLIAIVAAYGGMFVLALPISVIGNNFERIYDVAQGHLSHGVVYGIFELIGDHNDVNQLLKKSKFNERSNEEKSMKLINILLKKLSAVFILAKNLLSGSRCSGFVKLLKDLHIRVYLDAKIFLEEERLLRNGRLPSDYHRVITPEEFFWVNMVWKVEGQCWESKYGKKTRRITVEDPYLLSRELLKRLKQTDVTEHEYFPSSPSSENPQSGAEHVKMKRVSTLLPLPTPDSPDYGQARQRQQELEIQLKKLQEQLEFAQEALKACIGHSKLSSSDRHDIDLIRKRNDKAMRQSEEVRDRLVKEKSKKEKSKTEGGLDIDDCIAKTTGGVSPCRGKSSENLAVTTLEIEAKDDDDHFGEMKRPPSPQRFRSPEVSRGKSQYRSLSPDRHHQSSPAK